MITIFMHLLLLSIIIILLLIIYIFIKFKENNSIFIKLLNIYIYISENHDLNQIPEHIESLESLNFSIQKVNINPLVKKVTLFFGTVLVFLFFLLVSMTSYDNIYNKNYEILYGSSFILRGDYKYDGDKMNFITGVNYYLNEKYIDAEIIFDELLQNKNISSETLLYSGLNKMAQHKYTEAIILFNILLSTNDNYEIEAQWYIGLCYIKIGNKNMAISVMKNLSVTESVYKKKSQIILSEL